MGGDNPLRYRRRPMGKVGTALLRAAEAGPGTVAQLAEQADIDCSAARPQASKLVKFGYLVVHAHGRPRVLAAAAPQAQSPHVSLAAMLRIFWDGDAQAEGGPNGA